MAYNIYAKGLEAMSSAKRTENGAMAWSATGSAVVDLFAVIGALRNGDDSEERLKRLIAAAAAEDPLATARTLFYARDIRGGLGERRVFRNALYICASEHPGLVEPNLELVPEYGRWDDLFSLIGTPLEDRMWGIVSRRLEEDAAAVARGERPSPLAKWMPSAKTSSADTRALARYAAKRLGRTVYEYKRLIRDLRKGMGLLEQDMSAKRWSEIDYSRLPSQAHMRHTKAFVRNDGERYRRYIGDVSAGAAKINTGTLYPYEIVERMESRDDLGALEEMWKALPDYVGGGGNVIVMADTSGSMYGRPMHTSVGLAVYFAERNKGAFANMYMTFSEKPQLFCIDPADSLGDKLRKTAAGPWMMNTDLGKALDLLLYVAVRTAAPKEDVPRSIVVITDMEIDRCSCQGASEWDGIVDVMERKYREAGYDLPGIVFWNVASRHDTYLGRCDRRGVQMVSGSSPSVFEHVLGFAEGMTAGEAVARILSGERYAPIRAERARFPPKPFTPSLYTSINISRVQPKVTQRERAETCEAARRSPLGT